MKKKSKSQRSGGSAARTVKKTRSVKGKKKAKVKATGKAKPRDGDPHRNGVRDPRPPLSLATRLADPRAPVNKDRIALRRRVSWTRHLRPNDFQPWIVAEKKPTDLTDDDFNALLSDSDGTEYVPIDGSAESKDVQAAIAEANKADGNAGLTMLRYRYTKGLETVNDEMGYGERIRDLFWRADAGGKFTPLVRTSQRTKSGRQQLHPEENPSTAATGEK